MDARTKKKIEAETDKIKADFRKFAETNIKPMLIESKKRNQ